MVLGVLFVLFGGCDTTLTSGSESFEVLIDGTLASEIEGAPRWYVAEDLSALPSVRFERVDRMATDAEMIAAIEGLPAEARGPVYRYEVINLFPNGDFELPPTDLTTPFDGWGRTDALTTPNFTAQPIDVPADIHEYPRAIDGNWSYQVISNGAGELTWIDLATTLRDGFLIGASYAFDIDYALRSQAFSLSITGPGANPSPAIVNDDVGNAHQVWRMSRGYATTRRRISFPGTFVDSPQPSGGPKDNPLITRQSATDPTRLTFGGVTADAQIPFDGVFDRLTIVRADWAYYLRTSVHTRDPHGARPNLRPHGTYTFTIWYHPDPTAGSNNRMHARVISTGIDGSTAGERGFDPSAINARLRVATTKSPNIQPTDGWKKHTASFSAHGLQPHYNPSAEEITCDVVIEIGQSSLGAEGVEAGSILLAAPSLTWTDNE